MTERERVEARYRPNRQLENYRAAVMRGHQPMRKKEQAIARYAARLELERLSVEAAEAVLDARGVTRVGIRRLADTLAKVCASCRRLAGPAAVELLSEKAAARMAHRMDEALLFEIMEKCLVAVGCAEPGTLVEQARAMAKSRAVPHRPAAARPESLVGSSAAHVIPAGFVAELEQRSELEEFQQKKAMECLKEALRCIKPGPRQVIIDRIGRRKSLAELVEATGLSARQVRGILEQARAFVRKYTNYYDDEWFWFDETGPGLVSGDRPALSGGAGGQ